MPQILLLLMLFIAGCGVMNNPKKGVTEPQGAENGANDASAMFRPAVEYIPVEKFPVTDENNAFVNLYQNYEVFTGQKRAAQFFSEMNTTAQEMLSPKEQQIVTSWINRIKETDYNARNLLFYPLLSEQDCNLTVSSDNNHTLTVSGNSCRNTPTFYPLFFNVDKQIPEVVLRIFSEGNVTVENR